MKQIKQKSLNILYLVILIIIFLSQIGCGSDNKIFNPVEPPEPVDTSAFFYPFTDGSYWNYERKIYAENIRPDSIRYYFNSYPLVWAGYNEILYDTNIVFGGTVKVIYDQITENGITTASRYYYTNTENSLVSYAYRGGLTPSFPYRKPSALKFSAEGKIFNNVSDLFTYVLLCGNNFSQNDYTENSDTLILEPHPIVVLKYPIVSNFEWFFKEAGTSVIKKKYIRFENYRIDTARISCIKTQRIWTNNSNYVLYDYYSKYGQMKRDYLLKNQPVLNQYGITIGYADLREVCLVSSFHIAE
jgi:hypothetical protein